jgi:hypothetical protein
VRKYIHREIKKKISKDNHKVQALGDMTKRPNLTIHEIKEIAKIQHKGIDILFN